MRYFDYIFNFLEWGLSKRKNRKPFRKAFRHLSNLNDLGVPYELHSATIKKTEELKKLLGRKNSSWQYQIHIPDRPNLRYFLISGPSAPTNVLQLPFVTNFLKGSDQELLMIYVQTVEDGSNIFFDIYQFCASNNLIDFPTRKSEPEKSFAFRHSNLTEETKKKIILDAQTFKIRVLIATSSAGAGINLPISIFLGWGLDREPSGVVQASGRTARGHGEGSVVWVHNAALHGRRVPSRSEVRSLLKSNCFRLCQNGWFSEGATDTPPRKPEPHNCCSMCMENCLKRASCVACSAWLDKFKYISTDLVKTNSAVTVFSDFLKTLKIIERSFPESPVYDEMNLSKTIICHLCENNDSSETISFLEIFAFSEDLFKDISDFIKKDLVVLLSQNLQKQEVNVNEVISNSDSSNSESLTSHASSSEAEEYFDE